MIENFNQIKGVHPGLIIGRELKKRKLVQGRFAISVDEYPQTLGAIINGHRGINTKLSLKIEEKLGWEEGLLMVLQAYYDIKQEKQKAETETPDLSKFRKALFWDTDITKINWITSRAWVIKRVKERGNKNEKMEIERFYGIQLPNNNYPIA